MDKRSAIKVEAAPAPAEDDLDTKVNLNKQKDLIAAVQKVERSDQSDYEEEEEPTNTGGSKTLVAFNLSFQVERSDVEEFFKEAGQVVDVRFAKSKYGDGRFLGFGIVEFATAGEALKALEFHGRPLLGRQMRLNVSKQRGQRPAFELDGCDMEQEKIMVVEEETL
ncbi:hypothetical protein F2Q68_00024127 [Brassica cretica]|uniref:RRM domain-containing protein n=1 Tax=Brassica cretica TaxID=69181 RepID=A0A8S9I896_BRACR|nr:hypothetical protein F2Q68_00024127 [Brassica cretica]